MIQQAPVTLGRSSFHGGRRFLEEMLLFRLQPTLFDADGSFTIQGLRLHRRTAFVGDAADLDLPFDSTVVDQQDIAVLDVVGRFGTLAIEPDLATFNRLGGQRTRLEKACGPEPFIDTGSVHQRLIITTLCFIIKMPVPDGDRHAEFPAGNLEGW
jgi:hypothetical protein